ncbi:MAG TPA: NBR1-Ig-like domain-containing protein [Anaerolineales bacterium]|nr:NBR1-Ig-like domain-containing protein [Anaerolineales bacterium]
MSARKTKLLSWLIALSLVLACVPSFTVPSASTPAPGAVNTFIAQTANAASTSTAAALPTSTATPTITPTLNTDTPSPTVTATVIFILASPTPLVFPTFTRVPGVGGGSGGSGTSADNYACRLVSQEPPNGRAFNPRDDFDAVWNVRNIGQKTWDRNSVDYIHLSGDDFHRLEGYDLAANVTPGQTTNIVVDMRAPRNPGTYRTRWTLRVGSENFCPLELTIVVR